MWLAQPRSAPDSIAIDTAAVREAIATVFSNHAYDRSLRDSLWSRVEHWLADLVRQLFQNVGESPALRWALIAAAIFVIGAFAARLLYVESARARRPRARHAAVDPSLDPLLLARAAAGEGRFMDAAQLLYVAILHELRRSERILLDPAKTLGEYRRDLAARSSSALPDFRQFTRLYEAIVWGRRSCDASSFQLLTELAAPLIPRAHRGPGRA